MLSLDLKDVQLEKYDKLHRTMFEGKQLQGEGQINYYGQQLRGEDKYYSDGVIIHIVEWIVR